MSHGRYWLMVVFTVLISYAALPTEAQPTTCSAALLAAAAGADASGIDSATPLDACQVAICTEEDATACDSTAPPTSTLQLVLSDEFDTANQSFAAGDGNPKWTAGNMWYGGTGDWEVYQPQQVTTINGSVVLTIEELLTQNATALSQQGDGVVWNVSKDFRSGFVDSWNKMCFTGGYIETRVQLPGNPDVAGFWPAFWLMGNMGRAGYLKSTEGVWPYTYNKCGGDAVGQEFGDKSPQPQKFSACPDPVGFNRTQWGLLPEMGRGAPEIDIIEAKSGKRANNPAKPRTPFSLLPFHVAPLMPEGTSWTITNSSGTFPGPGQYFPKASVPEDMWVDLEFWKGPYAQNQQDRPGDAMRDVMGAYAQLPADFWTSYHTFGLHWLPGEYIRWYIDGRFVYELNKEALKETSNGTYTVFERLIPLEPMYVIFNLALSDTFGSVKRNELPFPSQFKLDYVRVYQNASSINIGCSPPDYPTEQYIACNRDVFLISEEEQALVNGTCEGAASCRQEAHVDYMGGDLLNAAGLAIRSSLPTVRDCCEACQAEALCGAYTYSGGFCYFKEPSGWTRQPAPATGSMSGVVYDAGSAVPRGTAVAPPTDGGNKDEGGTSGGGGDTGVTGEGSNISGGTGGGVVTPTSGAQTAASLFCTDAALAAAAAMATLSVLCL